MTAEGVEVALAAESVLLDWSFVAVDADPAPMLDAARLDAALLAVAPCDPVPAITPQASPNVTNVAAATLRRRRAIRWRRARRICSPRAVESALALGIDAG